jgi:predicted lipoprotein with Yx(FWY)xxD motif
MRNQRKSFHSVFFLTVGFCAVALQYGPAARADSPINCAVPVTEAPNGPATVSVATTAYGNVLVDGSADYAGCSLYIVTSDEMNALTSGAVPFACSDDSPLDLSCDAILWPAMLTDGDPIAGPGVNPTLLGTVTRTDVLSGVAVQQVTYAGLPLYRFFLDESPGETEGENLFDPLTIPTGIWYLVEPSRGHPAPGKALIVNETALVDGVGQSQTVLAARMNNDFSAFANASFPVYTLSTETGHGWGHGIVCDGTCTAVPWPPVLTSGKPEAGPGVDQHALGTIVRPDGTHQVTYNDKPLYLHYRDAYIEGLFGTQGIYGAGETTAWGEFNSIPPLQ